jgi:hypothetical protein
MKIMEFFFKVYVLISFKSRLRYLKFKCKNEVHNSNSWDVGVIDVLFIIKPQINCQTMAHQYPWLIIVAEVIVHLLFFRSFNLVHICKRYDFLQWLLLAHDDAQWKVHKFEYLCH